MGNKDQNIEETTGPLDGVERNTGSLQKLGKRIKQLRKGLGLSQKEFAQSLDVSNSYLCGVEKGTRSPKAEFFFKIVEQYNVSIDYLLFGIEPMKMNDKIKPESHIKKNEKEYIDVIETLPDLLWFMEHSTLFRDTIMGYAARFHLENDAIIKRNIENLRNKANVKAGGGKNEQ